VTSTEVADLTQADSIAGMADSVLKKHPGSTLCAGRAVHGRLRGLRDHAQGAPSRVASLVLLDTSARPDTPEATAARVALMKLAETDLEAVFEQLMPRLSHPLRMNLPAVRGVVHSMMSSLGKDVFIRQQGAIMTRPDSRPELARIQCPTLVICGRQDLVTPPELAEEIATASRTPASASSKTAGTCLPSTSPTRSAHVLLEWVRNIKC
jgi:pimeloyl-ACP methyl ester carboxylesterase